MRQCRPGAFFNDKKSYPSHCCPPEPTAISNQITFALRSMLWCGLRLERLPNSLHMCRPLGGLHKSGCEWRLHPSVSRTQRHLLLQTSIFQVSPEPYGRFWRDGTWVPPGRCFLHCGGICGVRFGKICDPIICIHKARIDRQWLQGSPIVAFRKYCAGVLPNAFLNIVMKALTDS